MTDRSPHLFPLLALVFLLIAAGSGVATRAAPQETSTDSFAETVDVELVNVEVRVLDKQDVPVTGLTADDFQVLHDGVAVPITNFTEFRDGVAVGGAASGSGTESGQTGGLAADHHLVAYFDDLHLRATHRGVLIDALEDFVSQEQIPAENLMILRQGAQLHIEAPFGSSRRDLDKTLEGLAKSPPGLNNDTATQQALEEIQRTWNQSRDATGSGEGGVAQIPGANLGGATGGSGGSPRDVTSSAGALGSGLVSNTCDIFDSRVEAIINGWMQMRRSQISTTLASLADSATYLAGLPGVKTVLYLSDALETMPGWALSNYADTICPGGSQNLAMNALGEELGSAFLALARHAAANRVTFYPVQGGGLQVSSAGSARDSGIRAGSIASFEASRRAGDQSGLIMLAEETGGRAVLNQNDYGQAFAEVGNEMLHFYSLAYQPPAEEPKPEHTIEVRVDRPDVVARYRQGYMQKSANKRFAESMQGALYLGLVDNPLTVRLGAGEFRSSGEGPTIMPLQIILPVELVSFVPKGDELMAGILVRVLTRNLESDLVGQAERNFQVKHDPSGGGEWMQLPVDLEIESGSHLLVVGVLDQESGVTSLVSTTFEVPSL